MLDKIKVLIVDDSSFMVKTLSELLSEDPQIDVIGFAKNGQDALEKIKKLKPDVITLDVDMPVMDGISAIRHIMIESPVSIVMLSSLFSHGDITFEALRLGAVDFMPKPSGAISTDIHDERHNIINRVKIAADEKIENIRRVKLCKIDVRNNLTERYSLNQLEYLVALGTTLGGPNSIIALMSILSPDIPAAVVVIQEISPRILPAFVDQFNEYTHWKVEVGREGAKLEQGVCYVCSYDEPLIVKVDEDNKTSLQKGGLSRRPLDDLFVSAAELFENNSVGVLLTGVGDDGSMGFKSIREKSGITIAQNFETCVYPNLTHSAIEQNVVDHVTDSNQIARQIELVIESRNSDVISKELLA